MKKKILLFQIIIIIFSYQALAGSLKWKASDIVGYNLKLIDEKVYKSFSFSADHNLVAASLGTVDGPITAPLWYWEIDEQGILLIKEYNGKILFRMEKLYESNGRIGVDISGKTFEYEKKKIFEEEKM